MSCSNDLISFYAEKIIREIGELYSLESMDLYKGPSYHGKYEGYGLSIKADADRKFNFGEISIEFYGKEVYNDRKRYIIEGTWQDLIKELYYKIPDIQRQRKAIEEKYKKAQELYDTVLADLFSNGPNKINDSLRIHSYTEYDVWATYGKGIDEHKVLLKNDKEVFHVKNGSVFNYVPGSWENEVREFCRNYKNRETSTERNEALKQLRKLRRL